MENILKMKMKTMRETKMFSISNSKLTKRYMTIKITLRSIRDLGRPPDDSNNRRVYDYGSCRPFAQIAFGNFFYPQNVFRNFDLGINEGKIHIP